MQFQGDVQVKPQAKLRLSYSSLSRLSRRNGRYSCCTVKQPRSGKSHGGLTVYWCLVCSDAISRPSRICAPISKIIHVDPTSQAPLQTRSARVKRSAVIHELTWGLSRGRAGRRRGCVRCWRSSQNTHWPLRTVSQQPRIPLPRNKVVFQRDTHSKAPSCSRS